MFCATIGLPVSHWIGAVKIPIPSRCSENASVSE